MTNTLVTTTPYLLDDQVAINLYQIDQPISTTGIAANGTGGLGIPTNQGPTQTVGSIRASNIGYVVYGCCTATVNAGFLVMFTLDATYGAWSATQATTGTILAASQNIGTPFSTLTVGQFGWFWLGGGIWNLQIANSVSATSQLTTTATTGVSGTGGTKFGAVNIDASTSAAATRVNAPDIMAVNQGN